MKDISPDNIQSSGNDRNSSITGLIMSASATFLLAVAMGLSAVIIPTTLQNDGISNTLIGLIMSLETIASILISLLFPLFLRFVSMKTGLLISTIFL